MEIPLNNAIRLVAALAFELAAMPINFQPIGSLFVFILNSQISCMH